MFQMFATTKMYYWIYQNSNSSNYTTLDLYNSMRKVKEEWKKYKYHFKNREQEIETDYEISNYGNIRNKKGRILKPSPDTSGYLHVILTIDKKRKSCLVHRMVAQTFCDNPNNYLIVDHLDKNKKNNYFKNLKWASINQNANNRTNNVLNDFELEKLNKDLKDGTIKHEQISQKYDIKESTLKYHKKQLTSTKYNDYKKVFSNFVLYFININKIDPIGFLKKYNDQTLTVEVLKNGTKNFNLEQIERLFNVLGADWNDFFNYLNRK